jgi:glycine oxidase
MAALVPALEAAGGRIEIAEVTDAIVESGRLAGVRTGDGAERRAKSVVLAAGSWSAGDWLPAEARPPVRPVKGQILTLRGAPGHPVCGRIVGGERCYSVPRADGRLVVGATMEELGFDPRETACGIHEPLREAYRTLPEIAELELVEAIAGLRPATPDNVPVIGPGAIDGLIVATGHFRNGILLAPLTAERVVALLTGDREAVAR